MFEIINIGQIIDLESECHHLGNDWGFYVDIEKSYSPYNQDKVKYYTKLCKIYEEPYCELNEEPNLFLYKFLQITLIITTVSYCVSTIVAI